MRLRARSLLGIATVVALLAIAGAALGATGSLTYAGCIANRGIDDCPKPLHNSFGNNVGLAVSPDGSTVYVVAVEGTLTQLSRGTGSALDYEDCFADRGARDCRD